MLDYGHNNNLHSLFASDLQRRTFDPINYQKWKFCGVSSVESEHTGFIHLVSIRVGSRFGSHCTSEVEGRGRGAFQGRGCNEEGRLRILRPDKMSQHEQLREPEKERAPSNAITSVVGR